MHTMRSDIDFWHKCPKPNCQSSFATEAKLERHMRIHNNDLDECQYCPYRYENKNHYERHLKIHFGIKDYKCNQCDWKFRHRVIASSWSIHGLFRPGYQEWRQSVPRKAWRTLQRTKSELDRHFTKHEGIILNCLICNNYTASYRPTILLHLRNKHGDVVGKNVNWDAVKHFVKRDWFFSKCDK